ncbi:MAG: type IV secretory system conjugative DNA transfer family protein, partial [Chloroflexi bacterium]|nr:type IV secretory system conjugative DNA transfer family protein [Chloroflexota bacterium]
MATSSFYLGRTYDLAKAKLLEEQVNYDPDDLTPHALVVGMTGSGKTGLCVDLLEEAALAGIPALMIDPKGDIANLLLH